MTTSDKKDKNPNIIDVEYHIFSLLIIHIFSEKIDIIAISIADVVIYVVNVTLLGNRTFPNLVKMTNIIENITADGTAIISGGSFLLFIARYILREAA